MTMAEAEEKMTRQRCRSNNIRAGSRSLIGSKLLASSAFAVAVAVHSLELLIDESQTDRREHFWSMLFVCSGVRILFAAGFRWLVQQQTQRVWTSECLQQMSVRVEGGQSGCGCGCEGGCRRCGGISRDGWDGRNRCASRKSGDNGRSCSRLQRRSARAVAIGSRTICHCGGSFRIALAALAGARV